MAAELNPDTEDAGEVLVALDGRIGRYGLVNMEDRRIYEVKNAGIWNSLLSDGMGPHGFGIIVRQFRTERPCNMLVEIEIGDTTDDSKRGLVWVREEDVALLA